MERGLYIAASGMLSEMVRQDQIANNLANASTPGFKADRATQAGFQELLLRNGLTGRQVGPLGLGVAIDAINTDFTPAPIRETGEELDFAIEGEGFFGVRTARGTMYTRGGQFQASARGTLVTSAGDEVLGRDGGPIAVGADGTVSARQIGVFNVEAPRKLGDTLVTGRAAGPAAATVRAGALEGSGVDPAQAMVDMIASFRAFESGQRVITTIDETLQKAANQVGTVSG